MFKKGYLNGVQDGLTIGLGYFSVSFSFGILAVKGGLGIFSTTLISMINLTSAGQFAGLNCILTNAGFIALICTQIIINLRYSLMSLSLSQQLHSNIGTFKRCIIAFFNTDEIFAVAMSQNAILNFKYMLGLATLPWIGWSSGTLCGATAGAILPVSVSSALGIALYAMFIAIVIPPAVSSKPVRLTVILAGAMSCVMVLFPFLSSFSIIICTVLTASFMAYRYPVNVENEEVTE